MPDMQTPRFGGVYFLFLKKRCAGIILFDIKQKTIMRPSLVCHHGKCPVSRIMNPQRVRLWKH